MAPVAELTANCAVLPEKVPENAGVGGLIVAAILHTSVPDADPKGYVHDAGVSAVVACVASGAEPLPPPTIIIEGKANAIPEIPSRTATTRAIRILTARS